MADPRQRLYFNDGWNGFSMEGDDDVLLVLDFSEPLDSVLHIVLSFGDLSEVIGVSDRGMRPPAWSWIWVVPADWLMPAPPYIRGEWQAGVSDFLNRCVSFHNEAIDAAGGGRG